MSRFVIGAGYAVYRGPSPDNTAHRHAAFQIAVADQGEVVMASDGLHRGPALVVAPMVRHRLLAAPYLTTFYVDPHCAFADRLRALCPSGIAVAPGLRDLTEDQIGPQLSGELDGRLAAAMDALAAGPVPMPLLAASVGLSPQRLRALAGRQLGLPLTRWRIWRRLAESVRALGDGQSLAEAASTGGFADQAHFTRQLREMLGLTPSAVLPLLRPT
ncbi:helix-turn-helix domain-containing protein [Nonomuraea sp. NPDC050556]|uniref:helix-turn-helix domain-containing protein n=1 Tax=Nonomuraea sp. NPDC050556 TaxID=3364369 RepID=UPI00379DE6DA